MLREKDVEIAKELGIIKEDTILLKDDCEEDVIEEDYSLLHSLELKLASAKDTIIYLSDKLMNTEADLHEIKEEINAKNKTISKLYDKVDDAWNQIRILRQIVDTLHGDTLQHVDLEK